MKLEGDYLFEASVPEVWSALFDPMILAAVMPGCEKLELIDGQYVGEIKVKVGPIQGKFTGKVDLKDKDEPHSYTMIVDGRGAPGFVKATAAVKLAPEGEATRVSYDTDAQIGGKIASVGQRLIEASARAIVAQSLEGLHTNIKLRAAAYRAAAAKQAASAPEAAPAGAAPEATTEALAASPAASEASQASTASPTEAVGKATEAVGKATEAVGKVTEAVGKATEAVGKALASAGKTLEAVGKPAEPGKAVDAGTAGSAGTPPEPTQPSEPAAPAAPAVAFTPIKTRQSDLANAVAKEVASSLFPPKVLVAIIVIQFLVIVWLLLRH